MLFGIHHKPEPIAGFANPELEDRLLAFLDRMDAVELKRQNRWYRRLWCFLRESRLWQSLAQ